MVDAEGDRVLLTPTTVFVSCYRALRFNVHLLTSSGDCLGPLAAASA
jgi:hypothetical protein